MFIWKDTYNGMVNTIQELQHELWRLKSRPQVTAKSYTVVFRKESEPVKVFAAATAIPGKGFSPLSGSWETEYFAFSDENGLRVAAFHMDDVKYFLEVE